MEEGGVERTASWPWLLPLPSRLAVPGSFLHGAVVAAFPTTRRRTGRRCGARSFTVI
ncbi:hypothetical protein [Streptomyces sp. NPDC001635]